MTVWWITLASSYLLCLVAGMNAKTVYSNGHYTKKYNKFFSFMSVAILVLVAGLRSGIGDTPTYIQGYKTDAPSTIAGSIKLLFSGKKDAGFYFYQGILKSIVNNPNVFIFLRNPYANAIFSRYCIDISTICPFSHFVAALWQGCVITQCSFLYVFQYILNVIIPCSKYHLVLSEVRVIMFIYIYLFFIFVS